MTDQDIQLAKRNWTNSDAYVTSIARACLRMEAGYDKDFTDSELDVAEAYIWNAISRQIT